MQPCAACRELAQHCAELHILYGVKVGLCFLCAVALSWISQHLFSDSKQQAKAFSGFHRMSQADRQRETCNKVRMVLMDGFMQFCLCIFVNGFAVKSTRSGLGRK